MDISNQVSSRVEAKYLAEQLMRHYSVQMKFLERYYSDQYKIKVSIIIDGQSDTSYFSPRDGKIGVSAMNMLIVMRQLPHLKHKMFYSLLLHEIGHAIYTPSREWENSYSAFLNIVEDNRIESHISKWNGATNFRMLRYIFQDKQLDLANFAETIQNPMVSRDTRATHIALALLRTIKPQPYIDIVCSLNNNVPRVARLQRLNREFQDTIMFSNMLADPKYQHLDDVYRNPKYINHYALEYKRCSDEYTQRAREMLEIVERIKAICLELAGEFDLPKQPQQPQKGKGNPQKECNGGDGPNEPQQQEQEQSQSNSQDKEEQEDQEEQGDEQNAQSSQTNSEDDTDSEDDTNSADSANSVSGEEDDEYEQLEKAIQDAMYEDKKIASTVGSDVGTLTNHESNKEPYNKVNISAFTTVRRRGIKGHAKAPSVSGSMRDFNLRRYARRKFDNSPIPKYFDRRNEETRGGSNPAIMFYLDISGSMSGSRIEILLNYVRSFYDKLHTSVDIRLFAFGSYTYRLTRHELSMEFMSRHLDGATHPQYVPPLPNEEVIIITDGDWATDMPPVYRRDAHIILIDMGHRLPSKMIGVRHLYNVSSNDLVKTLERATSSLTAKLKR